MAPYSVRIVTPSEVDDEDFDLEYFSRTYKPLSNLPTPPPSSRNSASCSPVIGVDDDTDVHSELLGMSKVNVNSSPIPILIPIPIAIPIAHFTISNYVVEW